MSTPWRCGRRQALLELSRARRSTRAVSPQLARELSNCPSGADGGDLGWIGPQDCAEELANELFHQKNPLRGIGLRPRLVHSRYGFHVVEVLGRKQGRQSPFEEVRERIAVQLAQQSRAKALHQYMQLAGGPGDRRRAYRWKGRIRRWYSKHPGTTETEPLPGRGGESHLFDAQQGGGLPASVASCGGPGPWQSFGARLDKSLVG